MAEEVVIALVGAFASAVVGGGTVAGLFYRAFKDRLIGDLKPIFARRSELATIEAKVETAHTSYMGAHDMLGQHEKKIDQLNGRVDAMDEHGSKKLRDVQKGQRRLELLLVRGFTKLGADVDLADLEED